MSNIGQMVEEAGAQTSASLADIQLMNAIENPKSAGALDAAIKAINEGANIRRYGGTPLVAAARFGAVDIAEYLLKSGADPNCFTGAPLCNALEYGYYRLAVILFEHGATSEEKHYWHAHHGFLFESMMLLALHHTQLPVDLALYLPRVTQWMTVEQTVQWAAETNLVEHPAFNAAIPLCGEEHAQGLKTLSLRSSRKYPAESLPESLPRNIE